MNVTYQFAHMGIHVQDKEMADTLSAQFSKAFALPVFNLPAANMVTENMEVAFSTGLEEAGHIAIYAMPMEDAIEDLRSKGLEVDMGTAKYNGDTLMSVYLKEPFGTFPVHILNKERRPAR